MKKKLLFVESNTTGTGMLALRKAAGWGLTPIFLCNRPERYLGLEETGSQVIVCDTNDLDELKKTIEANVSKEEICGVATTSEFYLEAVAELATHYGLPGNPPQAMRTARNKSLTRQALAKAGVGQPRFAIVKGEADLAQALATVPVPCVVKPADDSGSNDVLLCQTQEEVARHASKILAISTNMRGQATAQTVLIEEYVDAPEFSVEMFTWEGKTVCVGITEKSLTGYPYFVESRHIFPAKLAPEVEEEIRSTVTRALAAIGVKNGATHTELKLTAAGAKIIEINARLAGGMIPELIRHATGIDMLEQQIRCSVDGPTDLHVVYDGHAGIRFIMADTQGVLADIRGVEAAKSVPGVQQVIVTGKPGAQVQPPQNAYHRLGSVIVKGDTYEATTVALDAALDKIEVVLEAAAIKS
ncbi:ATP-grasp domain-containing protein [Tumebacillus lipolyticus]|uniref:ATP-grasp domain-containing protein n=1 Tax=Tumebacillus lipolyticus TaxID=1280370 RepID=A0ABW4ZW61_9BACL